MHSDDQKKLASTTFKNQSTFENFLDSSDLLFDTTSLDQALFQLSLQLNALFLNKHVIVIGVMNGALVTLGNLLPKLNFSLNIDYIHATRYENQTVGSDITWLAYPQTPLKGCEVLLVDDIFDEGVTLKHIAEYCYQQGATAVTTAVLLDKRHDRKVEGFSIDYFALSIPDRYVFGFGLDYKGLYRNAPGIYAITQ